MIGRTFGNFEMILCLWLFAIFPVLITGEAVWTKVGGTVVLQCYNEGELVRWFAPDGNEIKSDGEKYIVDSANNTVKVLKIGETDVGMYRCEMQDKNKTFEIFSGPHIKPLEKSVNLVQGDRLELKCIAWGHPLPRVSWIKNWDDENVEVTATDRISLDSHGKIENAILNITDVTYDDYGLYTCNATNEYDSVRSTTKVRVKDKLAPLWPFIGICAEVIVLVVVIIIYEKRKSKECYDEDAREEGSNLTYSNDHQDKEKVRLRK